MRRAAAVIGLTAFVGLLAGCGVVQRTLTVEFQTADSATAQRVVIADCGHLPGVSVAQTAAGDPNVIFDYSHATSGQEIGLRDCVTGLQETRPDLQIRDYRIYDGTDN